MCGWAMKEINFNCFSALYCFGTPLNFNINVLHRSEVHLESYPRHGLDHIYFHISHN